MHFGIKGMHWGVRRYQNKDGSLTEAGKKKYYKENISKYEKDANDIRTSLVKNDPAIKTHHYMANKYWDKSDAAFDKGAYDLANKYGNKAYAHLEHFDTMASKKTADALLKKYGKEKIAIFEEGRRKHWE
jgi:hypothetical protein